MSMYIDVVEKANPSFVIRITMAAPGPANIPPPWVCGWPNSSSQPQTGYTIPPPQQLNLHRPPHCGSFSVKNDRPLEFTWTTLQGNRVGAYITKDPLNPHTAHITFHTVLSVPDAQGVWTDHCIENPPLPVPPPAEFQVHRIGMFQGLIIAPQDPFSYRIHWDVQHIFFIQGVPWEDFTQQISVARRALVGPPACHNYRRL